MNKPDKVFVVCVRPVARVQPCLEYRNQMARGLFGCHFYNSCRDCKIVPEGFEIWGENGHLQASPKTRELMIHWVKITARKQWRSTIDGSLYGYRFTVGPIQHIRY